MSKRGKLKIILARMREQGYNRDKASAYDIGDELLVEALRLLATPSTKEYVEEILAAYGELGELRW